MTANLMQKMQRNSLAFCHIGGHYKKANTDPFYHIFTKLLSDMRFHGTMASVQWWLLNKLDVLCFIDSFYSDIVTALQTSPDCTLPKHKSEFYKYWCDQELDLLKQESVINHRIWTALGRPRYGNCFDEMQKVS